MTLSELYTQTLNDAKKYLAPFRWQMDEDTFLLIDTLTPPTWIARVSTTYMSVAGYAERTFYVIGRASTQGEGMEHFALKDYTLPVLAAYAQTQKEKESNQ